MVHTPTNAMAEADFINPGYYRFRIDGDLRVTDSASHFQSDNNRSAGQIIDLYAFEWQDTDWHGALRKRP